MATIEQVANQLVSVFWSGEARYFNVTQGGSITVNLTAITPAAQNLALRRADNFGRTSSASGSPRCCRVVKSHSSIPEEGAHASSIWSNGIISSSEVNVSTTGLGQYGTGLNTYSFQTYIREVGHALS